jgi:peptidoglycan/xylan/chitin deacetylase (PgdA/CDA1 family)
MRAVVYHGIVERRDPDDFFAAKMFAEIRDFEQQVAVISRRWQPLTLAEVHQHLAERRPFPPRAVHVSFDDGYRNTLTAAEILDRHNVPWTLFVVTAAVLDGYRPWHSRLADAVIQAGRVRREDGSVVDLSTIDSGWGFEREVKAEVMEVPAAHLEAALARVLALPGMPDSVPHQWPYLNLEELRQLHHAGVEIGNHSARHVNLVRCNDAELNSEIEDSRARLEAMLGAHVRFFAYPDGRFDRRVAQAVRRSHDLAMATRTVLRPLDPFAFRRHWAGDTVQQLEANLASYPGLGSLGIDLEAAQASVSSRARRMARRLRLEGTGHGRARFRVPS